MHRRFHGFLILALLMIAPASFGGANKNGKASVSFHLQAENLDNPKMIFAASIHGEQRVYGRNPEFSVKDMASFRPFPTGEDELSYGVVIYLKPHAAQRLTHITNANRGKWLAAQVNGRPVDEVIINDTVNDGMLVIWNNLTMADIETLEKALPRAEEAKKDKP